MLKNLASAYSYTIYQWLFFFYLYCFIGWIWETIYVSVLEKRFENRGFMKGPFLPIYGLGALMIMVATLPFRSKPILVFLFGMIGATILELSTGIAMEKIFKIKYWDYSHKPLNFKGHICLESSITWGAVALGMMYGFHRPVDAFVTGIPMKILNPVTLLLTVGIVADFATSFKAAIDLREFLVSFEKIKGELSKISTSILENKAVTSLLRRNPDAISKEYGEALLEYRNVFIKKIKATIGDTKDIIIEKVDDTKKNIEDTIEKFGDTKEFITNKVEETFGSISETIEKITDNKSEGRNDEE